MKNKFSFSIFLISWVSLLLISCCKEDDPGKNDEDDYRYRYVGEWAFKVNIFSWNITGALTQNDSVYSKASITKGTGAKSLTINYSNTALNHPFFVKTFDVDTSGNIYFYGRDASKLEGTFDGNNAVSFTYSSHPPGVSYKCIFSGERLTENGTLNKPPSVSTDPVTGSVITSARLNGTVIANLLLTSVYFEYGTTDQYGSITESIPSTADGFSIISVSANIEGLKMGEQYHFRIKAENSSGVTYGKDLKFTTLLEPITDIEGNNYNSVKIGSQTWITENLRTTKYNDGADILLITNGADWTGLSSGGYCWYNNEQITNRIPYGALYNWYAVNTGKLCPVGWHVPGDSDWQNLISFLGGEKLAGGKLKEPGLIHWSKPNAGATNETSFFGVPGGRRDYYNGSFYSIKNQGSWWSSSEVSNNTANSVYLSNSNSYAIRYAKTKTDGYSVRCIKDN